MTFSVEKAKEAGRIAAGMEVLQEAIAKIESAIANRITLSRIDMRGTVDDPPDNEGGVQTRSVAGIVLELEFNETASAVVFSDVKVQLQRRLDQLAAQLNALA